MNIKYIFTLVALTFAPASCWGASWHTEPYQPTHCLVLKKLPTLVAPAYPSQLVTTSTRLLAKGTITMKPFDKLPSAIIAYISGFLDPSEWAQLAQVNIRLYNAVMINMPIYKHLKELSKQHNGDLQEIFFDAIEKNYNGAIDIIAYLARYLHRN